MGLDVRIDVRGGFTWPGGGLTASGRFGDALTPSGSFVLTDGTGSGQANFVYRVALSVPATTMQAFDLKGGGGELDAKNVAMTATAVKFVCLEITTPGASTSLRFGPQNQTNAAQLWYGGVGATDYAVVRNRLVMDDPITGWAIGASTKKVCVYNPGAATVAARLLIIGTK